MNGLVIIKQLSGFVQEFYRVDFLEESDVMAQVGEERVFGEFGMLDFFAIEERPKPVECFCACAGSIDAETSVANECACFGEKVCGRLFERATAAAACGEVKIVTPHVASVQEPLCKNTRLVRIILC